MLDNPQQTEVDFQRQRVLLNELNAKIEEALKTHTTGDTHDMIARLQGVAEHLVHRSVWIVGGDGWAYDIGYGGLDHVLASGRNVNILVLDTEVYSNTGGQMSKATPLGAIAKFAAGGKPNPKKDLALLALTYGNIYVARIAMGANDTQTIKAFTEAEQFNGPSLIIAYSHCIAHGYDLKNGLTQQKLAVDTGYWPLFRFNPDRIAEGKNPFQLDSKSPSVPFKTYAYNETRYQMLSAIDPKSAELAMVQAQQAVHDRWNWYEHMGHLFEPKKPDSKNETAH